MIHLHPNQVPAALRGSYTGKRLSAGIANSVHVPADAGLWSGGHRDMFHAVRLSDGERLTLSNGNTSHARTYTLQPGIVVVRHSQGPYAGLHIYVHADDAVRLLPAPVELTDHERIVLRATCSYKSSYNGRDRYDMAKDDAHGQLFPTRADWQTAKESLIARKLLNQAGAITVAGRNAMEDLKS